MIRPDDLVEVKLGFDPGHRRAAAELYDEAFAAKLSLAIPDPGRRLAVLERALDPTRAVAATRGGELAGIAGFHDAGGSLTGAIDWPELVEELGTARAVRAAGVFALYERKPQPRELLMDGVCVASAHRGQGMGTKIFEVLCAHGRERGFAHIRLDVIDTNSNARRLYERLGFQARETTRYPLLKSLLGFSASTEMRLDLGF